MWSSAVNSLATLACAVAVLSAIRGTHKHLVEHVDRLYRATRKAITMSAQDTVNTLVAQFKKGTAEVVGKIAELQAQVDAGETVDLTELAAAARALDDIVPDPAPEPDPAA